MLSLTRRRPLKIQAQSRQRQIKKINAANRIIMTGTPIENKLADLWSLFDFLNPGLLGTAKRVYFIY